MTSSSRDNVRNTATQNGAKNSAYSSNQIAPNGDKIIHDGNRTQIGTKVYFGEKAAKDALGKIGG